MCCRFLALAALCLPMVAHAAPPSAHVDEFLDERTGTTITIVHEPLTFALERSALAAHARDYVSLTALEVDRSGEPQLYLLGYFWSTIDRRGNAATSLSHDKSLVLHADGRVIRLTPVDSLPKDLEASRKLLAPETARFEQAAYHVRVEQLRYISNSRTLSLRVGAGKDEDEDEDEAGTGAETYEMWSDARRALKDFVARIGPDG
jgi:hypothetical protein